MELKLSGDQAEVLHTVLERALDDARAAFGRAGDTSRALIDAEQEVLESLLDEVHRLRGHRH